MHSPTSAVFFYFLAPTFHGPSTRGAIKKIAPLRGYRAMQHDVGISLDKVVLTSGAFSDTHNETFPSQRRPSAFIRPMDDPSLLWYEFMKNVRFEGTREVIALLVVFKRGCWNACNWIVNLIANKMKRNFIHLQSDDYKLYLKCEYVQKCECSLFDSVDTHLKAIKAINYSHSNLRHCSMPRLPRIDKGSQSRKQRIEETPRFERANSIVY